MHGDQQLDSYQNPVNGPRENESVESPDDDGYRETAASYAADHVWDNDEDAERLASDVIAGREEDDTAPPEEDAAIHGRAASGEDFEDEADESLFFPRP